RKISILGNAACRHRFDGAADIIESAGRRARVAVIILPDELTGRAGAIIIAPSAQIAAHTNGAGWGERQAHRTRLRPLRTKLSAESVIFILPAPAESARGNP